MQSNINNQQKPLINQYQVTNQQHTPLIPVSMNQNHLQSLHQQQQQQKLQIQLAQQQQQHNQTNLNKSNFNNTNSTVQGTNENLNCIVESQKLNLNSNLSNYID